MIIEAIRTGELAQAHLYAEESLALNRQIGYLGGEFTLLLIMSRLEMLEGNQDRAKEYVYASFDCQRAAGEPNYIILDDFFGWIALVNGDYPTARQVFSEWLALGRVQGWTSIISDMLGALARTAWANGEFELVAQYCLEVEQASSHLTDDFLVNARYAHARQAISSGEYSLAFERLSYLTEHWHDAMFSPPVHLLIHVFGILAAAQGQHHRAAVLFGAQDFIARQLMNISSPREREEYQQALAAARAGLGEEEFLAALAEGKAMNLEQALAYARGE